MLRTGVKDMTQLQVQETQTQERFFEVPARILDLVKSFIESSTKQEYYWNKPPFRKVLRDGSYWQVYRDGNEVCVKVVTWRANADICTDTVKVTITGWRVQKKTIEDARTTDVMLVSRCREFRIQVFDVLRKLLYYDQLVK